MFSKKSSIENDERQLVRPLAGTMNEEKATATHRSPSTVHRPLPIVFMGSGPVAAKSLQLLANTFTIEAVITKPSTEHEMGSACPDVPLFLAKNNAELEKIVSENAFASNVCVLIDFGIIVSQNVINSFKKGIVNGHFSLLPELRGADPISFAILKGKQETGVSLMLLVEKMDEGEVIAQASYKLQTNETTPSLTEKLIQISYELIRDNLPSYLDGGLLPKKQDEWQKENGKTVSYTRRLEKSDGKIDWSKDAQQIEREVRAYLGWPRSRTQLGDIDVVVTKARVTLTTNSSATPGSISVEEQSDVLCVMCGDGNSLCIEQLIPAGKKEMPIAAFLRGYAKRLRD